MNKIDRNKKPRLSRKAKTESIITGIEIRKEMSQKLFLLKEVLNLENKQCTFSPNSKFSDKVKKLNKNKKEIKLNNNKKKKNHEQNALLNNPKIVEFGNSTSETPAIKELNKLQAEQLKETTTSPESTIDIYLKEQDKESYTSKLIKPTIEDFHLLEDKIIFEKFKKDGIKHRNSCDYTEKKFDLPKVKRSNSLSSSQCPLPLSMVKPLNAENKIELQQERIEKRKYNKRIKVKSLLPLNPNTSLISPLVLDKHSPIQEARLEKRRYKKKNQKISSSESLNIPSSLSSPQYLKAQPPRKSKTYPHESLINENTNKRKKKSIDDRYYVPKNQVSPFVKLPNTEIVPISNVFLTEKSLSLPKLAPNLNEANKLPSLEKVIDSVSNQNLSINPPLVEKRAYDKRFDNERRKSLRLENNDI